MPSTDVCNARRRLEAIIETALAMLDELDGDPDAEPSLGWGEPGPDPRDRATDDREDDGDLQDWSASEDEPARVNHFDSSGHRIGEHMLARRRGAPPVFPLVEA